MYVITPGNTRTATKPATGAPKKKAAASVMAEPAPFEINKPKRTAAPFGERKDVPKPEVKSPFAFQFSAGKVIFWAFVAGAAGLIYLSHIFATQTIMRDLNRMQKDYERTRRLYEDRVLTYQRKTGPAEIYLKAKAAGLEYGGLTDETIVIRKD